MKLKVPNSIGIKMKGLMTKMQTMLTIWVRNAYMPLPRAMSPSEM